MNSVSPLLFLDIDGVMNTTTSCIRHRSGEVFAVEPVMALRWLIRHTGAYVVVTSTRRRASLDHMAALFSRNGLGEVAGRVIGLTPLITDSDTDDHREEEILSWLEDHRMTSDLFAIIDDKPLVGRLCRRLVHTNADHGLSWAGARLAARMLGR